jgi:hypothetical protein
MACCASAVVFGVARCPTHRRSRKGRRRKPTRNTQSYRGLNRRRLDRAIPSGGNQPPWLREARLWHERAVGLAKGPLIFREAP